MANESARELIHQATSALRRNDAKTAMELAEQASQADPSSAEPHQIRGIALTRLKRMEEATISFRRAAEIAPHEPKHFYNLAVNLKDRGLQDEAVLAAKEALATDPNHPGARAIAGEPPLEGGGSGPWSARVGYSEQEHVLPFMYGIEKVWDGIGYGFLAIGCLLAILMVVHMPMGPSGAPVPKGQLPEIILHRDPLALFTIFLYIVSTVSTGMWMFIDVIDRRMKFTWMVPLTICGLMGFNAAPLALYIFVGRRLALGGVSKT